MLDYYVLLKIKILKCVNLVCIAEHQEIKEKKVSKKINLNAKTHFTKRFIRLKKRFPQNRNAGLVKLSN